MHPGFDDVWEWLGFGEKDSPNETIRKVNLNVLTLVEELLLKEQPTYLVVVGRKASHLITDYTTRIEEKGFMSCFYRLYRVSQYVQMKPPIQIPTKHPVILVVDTVHTGEELSIVLADLYARKIKVKKIFCYLRNEEGIENLVAAKLVDKENVVGLFSSSSEEEYLEEYDKLQTFFRSQLEPMDPDLCFNSYNVNKVLSPNELKAILQSVLKDMFGQRITIKRFCDRGLASNIKELYGSIGNNRKLREITRGLLREDSDCDVSCASIRLKMDQKKVDTSFVIIVRTESDFNLKKVEANICLKDLERCCMARTGYKKRKELEVKRLVCPACIDLLISDSILNELSPILIKGFEKGGLECKLTRTYRPIKL